MRSLLPARDPVAEPSTTSKHDANVAWGGLGSIDGRGGLGYGLLYCIDKDWWESWVAYVSWSWSGDRTRKRRSTKRPTSMLTEPLLDRDPLMNVIPGSMGSYEIMKRRLKRDVDYVLVPPGVWNVLYELYGGGPPVPRMVKPLDQQYSDVANVDISECSFDDDDGDIEVIIGRAEGDSKSLVMRLPDSLSVETHPWVINIQLCDPLQPYRRGDAGVLSVRAMATAEQPLWRLFAEIVCRFSLRPYKAFDATSRGQARLWKRAEIANVNTDPVSRFGPWNLLCKSRQAILPMLTENLDLKEGSFDDFRADWKEYTGETTVEGIGLKDGDSLLFEFAVLNKSGALIWPRDAAAKAGRVRRLAEEDRQFRQVLLGVDEEGNPLFKPPTLVGMAVDAMDATGRWFPVDILEVKYTDDDTDDEDGNRELDGTRQLQSSHKIVRVDFTEFGGHEEWIDVNSDKLATRGRFTSEAEKLVSTPDEASNESIKPAAAEGRVKPASPLKKVNGVEAQVGAGKICQIPGYGACGLSNLGNTCYFNAAMQCVSYLPLLRSYLLSAQYKTSGDLNTDNPLGTDGKLLEEFSELIRALWSAKLGEKSPNRFRAQLGRENSQFAGADQQDAQELLNYMLDMLHEDSNKVRKKPYVEALEDSWVRDNTLSLVGEESWRR
jgi:hypothetical protein